MFARFIAIGYGCYLVLVIPDIARQSDSTDAWWMPVAVLAIFGSGAALGVAASVCTTTVLERVAAINACAYVVVVALWFVAWNGVVIPLDSSLWFSSFPGVASFAAAVAWRPRYAFTHMTIAVLLAQSANHTVRDAPFGHLLVPDVAFALSFCALFLAAAVVGLDTGRTLDATVAETHAAAASAAAAEAKSVERERFDALVHDRVMSTLLAAARHGVDHRLRRQAARAVSELDELRGGDGSDTVLDASAVLARLRSAATEVDEDVEVSARIAPECIGKVFPAEPVRATAAALAEALRNSIRHAGASAARSVGVEVAPGRLAVEVWDDGVGFDPHMVGSHRLGVAVSIIGRMRQLAGGRAAVRSSPGTGTTVQLIWREPAP